MPGLRILLTSNASYDPARGGSTRSNLAWLRRLIEHGHSCRVICASLDQDQESTRDGISIRRVKSLPLRRSILVEEIAGFGPDWVLVSSEDVSHMLLREAARVAASRLVYLAHTPQFFPFGPESWNRDARAADVVKAARSVVVIGHSMADYVRHALGVEPAVIHPPIYGAAPFKQYENFDTGFVLMINPCQVKGISIFLKLARRFPQTRFAALMGWGTTTADRQALAALHNVESIETVTNIEEVLARTKLLLMPSLWYEGFGLIAMETMLRGIPVISSNSGGLQEACRGSSYVIPVSPITKYLTEFDDTGMPRAVISEQNIEPWEAALSTLSNDKASYLSEAERSRNAAADFVGALDPFALEEHLLSIAGN